MASNDRRRFTRVPFEAATDLLIDGHSRSWQCELIDLSLKGALLHAPENPAFSVNDKGTLSIFFEGSDVVINMAAEIKHLDKKTVGVSCTPIDLDSVSHLRRLIELNTGDSSLLDREVAIMHQTNIEEKSK